MKLTPEIRFNEFKEEYREFKLSELMSRYSENNRDEEFGLDDILSLSHQHGIVNRKELLDDTYSNVNHKNYIKTRLNDFVYGKSISTNYPYGLFKANNLMDGLLSTLYFTFRVNENINPTYLEYFFSHQNRANNFLKKYVLVGDRYITADANYILSGKIFIPLKKEQQKITTFLTSVNKKITTLKKKKTLLEQYKKGVVQKIFTQSLRFKQSDNSEFPNWTKKPVSKILKRYSKPVQVDLNHTYRELGIRSHGKGIFHKEETTGEKLGNKRVFWVKEDMLIMNIVFAWERAVAKTSLNEVGLIASHRFPMYAPINNEVSIDFIYHFFLSHKGEYLLKLASPGGAGRNKTLGQNEFEKLRINMPAYDEQVKIAEFLSTLDNQIFNIESQIEQTTQWKKGLLQKMFV